MECKKCLKVKDESVDQTSGLFWFTIATIFTRFSEGTRTPPNRRGPVEPCDFLYLPTLFINGAVANFVSPLQSFPIGKPVKINQKTLKGSSKRPWEKFCLTTKIISSILREKFRSNIGRETAKIQQFFLVSIWRSFSTTKLCK